MSATGEPAHAPGTAIAIAEVEARRALCRACNARPRTICAPLTVTAIEQIAALKRRPRRLSAGATIYAEQDPCSEYFTMLEGWAALAAARPDGRRVVLDYALPGDFLGFQADPLTPRAHSAIAVTAVLVCPVPRTGLDALIGADPAVAVHLAHLIAVHEARAHDHLVNSANRNARARIAHLLIELYFRQHDRLPHAVPQTIDLPLTLALIGEAVGLSPEHVSRSLRRLREQGVLHLHRGRLLISDPDALIRASGVEDRPLADEAAEPFFKRP
jgi:CRP-like cAMP-binding protein